MSEPPSQPFVSAGERLRAQAAVIAVVAVYGITNGLITPVLTLNLERDGISAQVIGFIVAISAVGTLIVSPYVPKLMARFGAVTVIGASLAVEAIAMLLLPIFTGVIAWAVIRFVMGVSLACLYIASEVWITELTEQRQRARVLAVYNAVMSVSIGLGPIIIVGTGTQGWAPFLAAEAIVIGAAMLLPVAARYVLRASEHGDVAMMGIIREAPSLVLGTLTVAIIFGSALGLLPVYGVRAGFSEDAAALMVTAVMVGGVVLQFPLGWLADRLPRYGVLFGCGLASVCSIPIVPLVLDAPIALNAVLFLWGGVSTAIYTVAMAIGGDRFKGAKLAMLMAAFGVMWGLGAMVGPLLGGWAMRIWDPHGLIAVFVFLPSLWLLFALMRHWHRTVKA